MTHLSGTALLLAAFGLSPVAHAADAACDPQRLQRDAIVACAADTLGRADALLNMRYRALMDGLPAARGEALRDVQRRWIGYRDAMCQVVHDAVSPGREAPIAALACKTALTQSRVGELDYLHVGLMASDRWRVSHPDAVPASELPELPSGKAGTAFHAYADAHCALAQAWQGERAARCQRRMVLQLPD